MTVELVELPQQALFFQYTQKVIWGSFEQSLDEGWDCVLVVELLREVSVDQQIDVFI